LSKENGGFFNGTKVLEFDFPIPSGSRAQDPEGTENPKYWQSGHQSLDFSPRKS
jgi:hypothetical protein